MNLIFLDFDETMNSIYFRHVNKAHIRAERNANPNVFKQEYRDSPKHIQKYIELKANEVDLESMGILDLIIQKTKAKIVISSSWRNQAPFESTDKNETIKRFNKMFYILGYSHLEIIGITPDIGFRGAEVAEFLDNFSKTQKVDNYIILDDGADFFIDNLKLMTDNEIIAYANIHNKKGNPVFKTGDEFRVKSKFWSSQHLLRTDPVTGLSRKDALSILEHFSPDELLVHSRQENAPYEVNRGIFNSNSQFAFSDVPANSRVRPK